ncbi:MAG: hypothetical protein ACTHMM_05665 [Agriterribacter sp.]
MPKPKRYITDDRVLEVIDALKAAGIIRFRQTFLDEIKMPKQHIDGIKNRGKHFSAEHIRLAKEAFPMINLDFIFSDDKNVFVKDYNKLAAAMRSMKPKR